MSIYTVGDYLLDRLQELGVRHLFGVPGDYVLGFNAQIEATPGRGVGGELQRAERRVRGRGLRPGQRRGRLRRDRRASAISGPPAESAGHSPSAAPSWSSRGVPGASRPRATHHTAGDGDFSRFERIYAEITVAHTTLTAEQRRRRDRPGAGAPVWLSTGRSSSPCPPTLRRPRSLRRRGGCSCGPHRTRTSSSSSPRRSPAPGRRPPARRPHRRRASPSPAGGRRWPPSAAGAIPWAVTAPRPQT